MLTKRWIMRTMTLQRNLKEIVHIKYETNPLFYTILITIKINDIQRLQEILSSLIGFMIAAFDTTSSTLNFCLYCMVKYPDEMAKLQQEVDSVENV